MLQSSAALKMGTRRGHVTGWTRLVQGNPSTELEMSNCFGRLCPPFFVNYLNSLFIGSELFTKSV